MIANPYKIANRLSWLINHTPWRPRVVDGAFTRPWKPLTVEAIKGGADFDLIVVEGQAIKVCAVLAEKDGGGHRILDLDPGSYIRAPLHEAPATPV